MGDDELLAMLRAEHPRALITRVETTKDGDATVVQVFSAYAVSLIGRGGATASAVEAKLQTLLGPQTALRVVALSQPELEPLLIAETLVRRLESGRDLAEAIDLQVRVPGLKSAKACRIVLGGPLGLHERIAGEPPPDWSASDIRYAVFEGTDGVPPFRSEVWIVPPR